MKTRNKVHIHNRLFFKLYINYAVMLLITAVLICLIFINLYKKSTMEKHEEQLVRQVQTVSTRMSEFIQYKKYNRFFDYHNTLEEVVNLDIWTISNPNAINPMDDRFSTTNYEEIVEMESYKDIIDQAFKNQVVSETSYDEIYEMTMITLSAPIIGVNGEVVGVVMAVSPVEGQNNIVYDSFNLMLKSSIVALGISFVALILFAKRLSVPISKMRVTSLELASGNFKAKTDIDRKDEIGDLAKTIDILALRLLENEKNRLVQEQIRLDFFANISHELRTPITVIKAYTETLVDGMVTDEEKINQYYGRMLSECASMERLVGDLMHLSKLQHPDFTVEKEPVNIGQIFQDIGRAANVIGEEKNIKININKDSDLHMVWGDYGRLKQMFMIILDNAVKFSEEGQTIYIKIETRDKIRISIRDEGVGIAKEDLDNVFDKFYKSNLRQNATGTGLGLAIARQISLKHEGDIEVYSEHGKGTEFIFTLEKYKVDY